MMNVPEFPDFVPRLPEADLPFVGLRGWLLQGESGQVLFNESDVEVSVPEHSHGDPWGMVVDGRRSDDWRNREDLSTRGCLLHSASGSPPRQNLSRIPGRGLLRAPRSLSSAAA
jgi:hypothetical protein